MADLFPVFEVPSAQADEIPNTRRYYPAPAWDMAKGDFITDGAGKIKRGSGYDSWVLWCMKTVQTQRWAHMAYSGNAGIEYIQAFAQPTREAQESYYRRTITEALLADPMGRTNAVRDFSFEWEPDSLHVKCTVFGKNGDTADITVPIKRG